MSRLLAALIPESAPRPEALLLLLAQRVQGSRVKSWGAGVPAEHLGGSPDGCGAQTLWVFAIPAEEEGTATPTGDPSWL